MEKKYIIFKAITEEDKNFITFCEGDVPEAIGYSIKMCNKLNLHLKEVQCLSSQLSIEELVFFFGDIIKLPENHSHESGLTVYKNNQARSFNPFINKTYSINYDVELSLKDIQRLIAYLEI